MLTSVELNCKMCFRTVKVNDIVGNRMLTDKTHGVASKKVIPQVSLFFCHSFSQLSRKVSKRRIVFLHLTYPHKAFFIKSAPESPLLLKGGQGGFHLFCAPQAVLIFPQ